MRNSSKKRTTARVEPKGRLDEDGYEEREAEGLTAEINPMGSSAEGPAAGDSEESEKDSEEP